MSESHTASSTSPPTPLKKRKRNPDVQVKAPAKRRAARKSIDIENEDLNLEIGLNNAIGRMDSRLLADYVAQRTKRFEGDLSRVELEDKHIPERAFYDTTSWEKQRNLENLSGFLEQFSVRAGQSKNLSFASKTKGSPHTIVVTGAGLRAADLTRALRIFQTKDTKIAKLFAKHIKLKDAISSLKNNRINIAVGTPIRLIDLLDEGALKTGRLERVVIDSSHIDQKKRGIFDMKETHIPLMQLLNREGFRNRYNASKESIDLLLY
ncbi:MAG: hypothetical protein M1827_007355 [Pycnora praestabilis]|nr:MAG: hypothetical protein M1827_007355 [Pycnora praestabilis]